VSNPDDFFTSASYPFGIIVAGCRETDRIHSRKEVNLMSKRRFLILASGTLIALLLSALVGATIVFADEPDPEPEHPLGGHFLGRRGGRLGPGMFGRGVGSWTTFDTIAEALDLSPVELFTELHGGKSLDEIATEKGVDMEAVQSAIDTARAEAMKEAIQQAVEDGRMTQDQAGWLLEGAEKGFTPMGPGFGRGRGVGGFGHGTGECPCIEGTRTATGETV
jgi:hypothetical protein